MCLMVLIGSITFDVIRIENTVDNMKNIDNLIFSFQMFLSKYLYVRRTSSIVYLNL